MAGGAYTVGSKQRKHSRAVCVWGVWGGRTSFCVSGGCGMRSTAAIVARALREAFDDASAVRMDIGPAGAVGAWGACLARPDAAVVGCGAGLLHQWTETT